MKIISLITLLFCILMGPISIAQNEFKKVEPLPENWTVNNRRVDFNGDVIHLNGQEGDGELWLNDYNFKNGIIELDIRGKNNPGQSFVGVAFHGEDNSTFDAIYFRPFNFKNPDRNDHSVQYISMPRYDWSALRNTYLGKYENTIQPLPDPVDDWFHVKIVVDFPNVKVYVNGSEKPTLEVEQISDRKQGKIGLWVGNGSEGWFKNLKMY